MWYSFESRRSDKFLTWDVTAWNALMSVYAQLDQFKMVLKSFRKMIREGVFPDPISFLILLNACSHDGLVEVGERIFEDMKSVYSPIPTSEHYNCMVDIWVVQDFRNP